MSCSRARDNSGSLRQSPEKTICSFPYRFSGKSRNSGLVPGNRDPKADKDQKGLHKRASMIRAISENYRWGRNHYSKPNIRGRELNPNIFFSNFSGASGISRQNPGISRPKSLISLVSRDVSNFLAPTPSRGRPPPHQKISGLKSLGLGSFFVPEI